MAKKKNKRKNNNKKTYVTPRCETLSGHLLGNANPENGDNFFGSHQMWFEKTLVIVYIPFILVESVAKS